MKRKIVRIDQDKCDGCGLCAKACAEKAIEIVDGKARLVRDDYCDGLGACLGKCPRDAITIEERDAAPFDEEATKRHMGEKPGHAGHVCPGMRTMSFDDGNEPEGRSHDGKSQLRQWPIQLHLVPTRAPYWENADLLVAADCVAFSHGAFHDEFLKGKRLVVACPKLDDTSEYLEKLTAIIRDNSIKSVEVAQMEVPCCAGITRLAETALAQSGKRLPLEKVVVGLKGTILERKTQH